MVLCRHGSLTDETACRVRCQEAAASMFAAWPVAAQCEREGSVPTSCSCKSSRPHEPCQDYKEKVKGFQLPEVLHVTCWTTGSILLSQSPRKRLYCAYVCGCMNGYCKCVLIFKRAEAGGDSHLLAARAIQTRGLINGLLHSPFDCFTCICSPRTGSECLFSNCLPENSLPFSYGELWNFEPLSLFLFSLHCS